MDPASTHPNDLDLELARTGEAQPVVRSHLDACAECRARASWLDDLARALRVERGEAEIPQILDARLLREARRAATRRQRRAGWRWAGVAAAAALLLVAVWTLRPQAEALRPPAEPVLAPVAAAQDVNGDGTVDVLDAYWLARRIESDADLATTWDFDGNGRIDRDDVDAIAADIVRLAAGVRR